MPSNPNNTTSLTVTNTGGLYLQTPSIDWKTDSNFYVPNGTSFTLSYEIPMNKDSIVLYVSATSHTVICKDENEANSKAKELASTHKCKIFFLKPFKSVAPKYEVEEEKF